MKRTVVGLVCIYEAVAIFSRRIPTVSALCAEHRILAAPVLIGLAIHLLSQEVKEISVNLDGTGLAD